MGPVSLVLRVARALARHGGPVMIGVLALCAIVWFAGPRVGFPETPIRLYIIGGIVGVAALGLLVHWLLVRRRGRRMQSEMAAQQDPKAAEREADLQALREKMDEAVAALKTSELGGSHRGAAALYALPWYMIIGPSAAGKSTLLCNSGLHFPYANAEDLHLRGFGGTRNCDWWFSDQAVILDTAGRYTTEEDDREEWFTFLHLLRRHRGRMPLNGVLVAISVSDLLTADSAALERHVKIIRERIDELIRELALVFPVYLVFTKCDLIKGFEAYFGDLSDAERDQVWGAYLLDAADDGAAVEERFNERMEALRGRLCELRLRKLSMERNLARKGELYDFPSQFLAASETLGEFVRLLFRGNPYQETPMLAGVYLASSTQGGTPLQRALGGLRQAFGHAAGASAGQGERRPFFIKRLFTDVIFQLPGVVRRNRRRLLWGRWFKGAAVAASLAVIGVTLAGLSGAYGANALLLTEGEARVAAVRSAALNSVSDLAGYTALEGLLEYYENLRARERDRPWTLRYGVYTAAELIPGIEAVLFRALGRRFRDPVLTALEYRLEDLSRQWKSAEPEAQEAMREEYHTSLRDYLVAAEFTNRLDVERTAPLMADLWARHLGLADYGQGYADVRKRAPRLDGLVRFYLDRAGQEPAVRRWPVRAGLVQQARKHLITPPSADRLYARIRHGGEGELGSRALGDLLTGENRGLVTAEVRLKGFYTARGWYEFTRGAIEEAITTASSGDWVLAAPLNGAGGEAVVPDSAEVIDEALAAELRDGIRARYFADYVDHWLTFLGSVRPEPYASLEEAAPKLLRSARSYGPIGELMQVAARNVNLYESPAPDLGLEPGNSVDPRSRVPELQAPFADLRRFANPGENKSTSDLVHQYLLLLTELKNATARLSASADLARDAERYAAQVLSSNGSDSELYRAWVSTGSLLNGTGAATRQALEPLLTQPISDLWRSIVVLAREQIQSRWRAVVIGAYQERLRGRFPFAADGADASLDDVSAFFRPDDGILWGFVNDRLGPYLERTREGWRGRSWLGVRPGFTPSFLGGLEAAQAITDALFRDGGSRPEVVFHLYPLPAAGLSEIVLESNGQSYRYRNGPQEWRRFQWPGDLQRIGALVAGTISRGNARAELEASGPWGLFHLLRDAEITSQTSTIFKLEWQLTVGSRAPVPVRFMVRAGRQDSLFGGSLMSGFALPGSLFAGVFDPLRAVAEVR